MALLGPHGQQPIDEGAGVKDYRPPQQELWEQDLSEADVGWEDDL